MALAILRTILVQNARQMSIQFQQNAGYEKPFEASLNNAGVDGVGYVIRSSGAWFRM